MGVDDSIDITGEQRRTILALLERYLPDTMAWVYGSRVKWTSRPKSDLDLVVFATPGQRRQVGNLREAFEESNLPFRVDLFVWDEVPGSFREQIERDHEVLVSSGVNGAKWRTLGDLAEITMGQSPPGSTANRERAGTPLLNGPTEFGPHHPEPIQYTTDARRLAYPGDLLFCVRGSTGRMNWADRQYAIGRGIAAIRHRQDLGLQPFVRAIIEFALPELLARATGSTFSNISAQQLGQVRFPGITLPEQKNIAHILGTLDDKIELNRRMNETLEAMARALFQSWFVDFDPVRAKMEGRATGLPDHLSDLFPDRLVDSEIGEIPEGWEVSEIGKEVKAVGGATPSTKNPSYWDQGHHCWATPKDLSKLDSPVLLETNRKITNAGLRKIRSGALPVGTVLLSSRAPIGYLAITEVHTAVNQGFIAMICDQRLPNLYVLRWCDQSLGHIRNIAGGSTFAEISKKVFRPIPVLVPPERTLGMYERLSRPLHERLVANTKECVTLGALRGALLPKLVSGKIRIPVAHRAVAPVT